MSAEGRLAEELSIKKDFVRTSTAISIDCGLVLSATRLTELVRLRVDVMNSSRRLSGISDNSGGLRIAAIFINESSDITRTVRIALANNWQNTGLQGLWQADKVIGRRPHWIRLENLDIRLRQCSLGPEVSRPSRTSIRSAVFAHGSYVTPGIIDRNILHLIHSMRPNDRTPQSDVDAPRAAYNLRDWWRWQRLFRQYKVLQAPSRRDWLIAFRCCCASSSDVVTCDCAGTSDIMRHQQLLDTIHRRRWRLSSRQRPTAVISSPHRRCWPGFLATTGQTTPSAHT